MLTLKQFDHIALTVRDLKRSEAFYREHFGFEPVRQSGDHLFLRQGNMELAFFQVKDPRAASGPIGWDGIGVQHIAFTVDRETFERARRELPAKGLQVRGPVDHGTCDSLYFADPDGYDLELTYPK